jgi:hypothetical protein
MSYPTKNMTKRDFELIAEVISSYPVEVPKRLMAHKFADKLAATNSRFNRQRFLDACGIDSDLVEEPTP